MQNQNTFGVHYLLRKLNKLTGLSQIFARISVNDDRTELALKCYIKKSDWNFNIGIPKTKTDDLKKLDLYLEDVRRKFRDHYKEMELKGDLLTADSLKEAYLGLAKKDQNQTLLGAMESHHRIMSAGGLEEGTLKNYRTTFTYLKMYCAKKYPSKDIYLRHLDYTFITEMECFIHKNPLKKNKPCTRNGLMKHMERLKKVGTWAFTNGWVEKDPFLAYKLKFEHKEREFLDHEELLKLENFPFQDPHIQYVVDLFIFACYTGLDYADVINLKEEELHADIYGNYWLYGNRKKGGHRFVVPVLSKSLEIINKFTYPIKSNEKLSIFPWISNQEVNRCLKVAALIVGISKRLHFKLARHTFATTVTLLNQVPIESISKMLGHKRLSTTMIYSHITHAKIGMDMRQLQAKIDAGIQEIVNPLPHIH